MVLGRQPSTKQTTTSPDAIDVHAMIPRKEVKLGYSNKTAAALLAPAGLIMILLVGVPAIFLIFTSFTDFNQRSLFTGEFDFTGISAYVTAITDSAFWLSTLRTIGFALACVSGTVLIGMAVAQFIAKLNKVIQYVVTITLILAWSMPDVAAAMVWKWLFQPGYGVVNWLLTKLMIFGNVTDTDWSNNAILAYACIWLLLVWQSVPFIALTLYAAIQQVDASCLEAAKLDGAGPVRLYWSIIVPLVKPTLLLLITLSVIWDFSTFNQVWLVSKGGPNDATSILGVFAYKKAFVGFDIGQGAAISVLVTFMLIGLTAIYIKSLLHSGEDL